jgi:hypothetical protein
VPDCTIRHFVGVDLRGDPDIFDAQQYAPLLDVGVPDA